MTVVLVFIGRRLKKSNNKGFKKWDVLAFNIRTLDEL